MMELSGKVLGTFCPLGSGSSQTLLSFLTAESVRKQWRKVPELQPDRRVSFKCPWRVFVKAKAAFISPFDFGELMVAQPGLCLGVWGGG